MTGLSLEDLRVTVQVPQSLIAAVAAQNHATITFPGTQQPPITVEHLTVFPYADPQSHTVKVRMNLPKGMKTIRAGTFVKVSFATGESRVLLVPSSAVIHRSELTAVYVMAQDGSISLRQVRTGQRHEDGKIEILSGLGEGEKVVLDPVQAGLFLKERQAVNGN